MEVEHASRVEKEISIASIDLEKAFDNVNRDSIYEAVMKSSFSDTMKKAVWDIFRIWDKCKLFVNKDFVGEIVKTSGIRQGCTLSPMIFNMTLNGTIDRLNTRFPNNSTNALFFADDALLIGHNKLEIKTKINILREELEKIGLKLNKDKSGIIHIGKPEKHEIDLNDNNDCKLPLPLINEIKYLGLKVKNSWAPLYEDPKSRLG